MEIHTVLLSSLRVIYSFLFSTYLLTHIVLSLLLDCMDHCIFIIILSAYK